MEIRTTHPIAVVGAGTMGAGIAQVAATVGHPVTVVDQDPAALSRGRASVKAALDTAVAKRRLEPAARDEIEARITWSTELTQVARKSLVIEAIVEKLDAKQHLIGTIARVALCNMPIASNTSSLGIGELAQALATPDRFLGLHFFNPVPAMKLVEVIAGPKTSQTVIAAMVNLMLAWGKHPVVVRDVPGFIVNRVARPYYGEGFAAVDDGIAPATVDAAMTGAGGFRMGPLGLADMIGHDVNFTVACSVHDAYAGRTRFRPQKAQRALVEAGRLGCKSGLGVYDHGKKLPVADFAEPALAPVEIALCVLDLLAPLGAEARAAKIAVVNDPTLEPDMIRIGDSVMALGDGRRFDQRPGVDILIDHVRDFATATTCVISARSPTHAMAATGLLQAIGRRVVIVPDRAGQVVLRTLAQLANAAADAEIDEVADANGIDEAMLHGANHPEGPLGWARRIGHDRVRTALSNIAHAEKDSMYEPSPFFDPR
ncbi:3-hydroxyacyl-CoA dehydrogenase NAD-binding domain-containing protein [Sphingomonas crocodyli]|uniref:3-hydroxyacyl-CoA dehydrogenase n=1 Tax=Sphingomonas crocodyli TaxID=1979270 RepID=A0A437M755_9SPHN|nr:3-hydroxyacyl-CoA dehydrogenase NAD-binding domain-containing protein [Sphingomonas crocodyli]RVT93548.1 3-hydroxyacyl-CoA dehydrogenase [Sphingomonas crocodyli]